MRQSLKLIRRGFYYTVGGIIGIVVLYTVVMIFGLVFMATWEVFGP